MKRGLAFALAALALVVGNVTANAADIDLSLNLRYTDPANPTEGGRWFLLAKNNVAGANTGIAGLNVYLNNISSTGIVWGNATVAGGYTAVTGPTLGANVQTAGNVPFVSTTAGVTNLVYGQDLVTKVTNVGDGAGTPGAIADPLKLAAWDNSSLIMSGTFAGGGNAGNQFNRPTFAAGNDGTLYNGSGAIAAGTPTISTTVRGDSLVSLGLNTPNTAGLRPGDANRDFAVNLADFAALQNNYNQGPGTKGWDQGDFNNDSNVNLADFALLQNNYNQTSPAPTVAAVPEPCALMLSAVGFGLSACAVRRRSR